MTKVAFLTECRKGFHKALLEKVLCVDHDGIPSIADRHSRASTIISKEIVQSLGEHTKQTRLAGQMSGNVFEAVCAAFIEKTFKEFSHLRPGLWQIEHLAGNNRLAIAAFAQYKHLLALEKAAKSNSELAAALGSDYTITPDIVICRMPEPDKTINAPRNLIDKTLARLSPIREINNDCPILHASISCKWTIRSDRAQNARSEALNLVKNRKGPLPHVVVITAEPLPARISSLALGTGEIDCVYHFALPELKAAVAHAGLEDAQELLEIMVGGKRLRDIADLPLDLCI